MPGLTGFRPGLEDALLVARTGKGVSPDRRICTVCTVIQHADTPEAKEALVSAAAGTISAMSLQSALRSLGVRITRVSIFNHRNEAHQP